MSMTQMDLTNHYLLTLNMVESVKIHLFHFVGVECKPFSIGDVTLAQSSFHIATMVYTRLKIK